MKTRSSLGLIRYRLVAPAWMPSEATYRSDTPASNAIVTPWDGLTVSL